MPTASPRNGSGGRNGRGGGGGGNLAPASPGRGAPRSPRSPSSSSNLIETLLAQTARLQTKLESSLSTTNGLIHRASALKTRLGPEDQPVVGSPSPRKGAAHHSPAARGTPAGRENEGRKGNGDGQGNNGGGGAGLMTADGAAGANTADGKAANAAGATDAAGAADAADAAGARAELARALERCASLEAKLAETESGAERARAERESAVAAAAAASTAAAGSASAAEARVAELEREVSQLRDSASEAARARGEAVRRAESAEARAVEAEMRASEAEKDAMETAKELVVERHRAAAAETAAAAAAAAAENAAAARGKEAPGESDREERSSLGSTTPPGSPRVADVDVPLPVAAVEVIRTLEDENASLRASQRELEDGLEEIMERYRYQVVSLNEQREVAESGLRDRLAAETAESTELRRNVSRLQDRLVEMMNVMREAVRADEDDDAAVKVNGADGGLEGYVVQIETENEGLREMLRIAGVDIKEGDGGVAQEEQQDQEGGQE